MQQSGDDVDLDDKILESTQRQPEDAVANAAYENEEMDNVLDSVSPEKDLEDHHSPRSDEAEPESADEQQAALETIKEVTEDATIADQSDERKKTKKKTPKKKVKVSEQEEQSDEDVKPKSQKKPDQHEARSPSSLMGEEEPIAAPKKKK